MPAPTEQAYPTRLSESESLLREAMQKIPVGDNRPSDCELVTRIAVFLDGEPETNPEWDTPIRDQDLVWYRLPNGEYAWLRADMTGPRR